MANQFKRMTDLDLKGKRVLIREDLNVPIKEGSVHSAARLEAALPTIQQALNEGAAVIVMSHLGRPTEGEFDDAMSLQPVALWLSERLGQEVRVIRDWQGGVDLLPGQVVLLDNIRFYEGEKGDDKALAQKMAALCDIYVMDAFGTSHRAQASTHGVGYEAPIASAGPLLAAELDNLAKALSNPQRPMIAVVGGSKVSTKLTVLDALSNVADQLIPGGGIANTFIAAAGFNVGNSLVEMDLIDEAQRLISKAKERGGEIPIPTDVVVAKEFSADAKASIKRVEDVQDDDMIFDIGPETAKHYAELLENAGTILWNGPVGVFEFKAFGEGTRVVGEAIANSKGFSIAGGGDTLAAIDKYNLDDRISYISTGGGAFLEFVEGKELPAVTMLKARATA